MSVADPSRKLSTDLAEMSYLTVAAGALALIPVALVVNHLHRTGNYSTATATAAKVIIGTVITAWVVAKTHH